MERVIGLLKLRFKVLRTCMDFKLKNIRIVIFACILVHNFLRDHCVDDMGADLRRDDDDPFEESDDEEGGDDIIEFDFESGDEWRAWMARAIWDEYVEMRAGETASAAEDTEYSPEEMGRKMPAPHHLLIRRVPIAPTRPVRLVQMILVYPAKMATLPWNK